MKIHLVTTGGTIEKIYSEQSGQVENQAAKIDRYLQLLRLPDATVEVTALMNKDSLEMTAEDRELVLAGSSGQSGGRARCGDAWHRYHGRNRAAAEVALAGLRHAVVLTGAMTPLGFERSDGLQNLTESLLAARILHAGVWIAMHNQVFDVDHARKDRDQARFVAC